MKYVYTTAMTVALKVVGTAFSSARSLLWQSARLAATWSDGDCLVADRDDKGRPVYTYRLPTADDGTTPDPVSMVGLFTHHGYEVDASSARTVVNRGAVIAMGMVTDQTVDDPTVADGKWQDWRDAASTIMKDHGMTLNSQGIARLVDACRGVIVGDWQTIADGLAGKRDEETPGDPDEETDGETDEETPDNGGPTPGPATPTTWAEACAMLTAVAAAIENGTLVPADRTDEETRSAVAATVITAKTLPANQ